jgi:small subunit ribosomal protein S6
MALVYDLMLLLDTSATDAQREKILADTEAAITAEGTLVGKHDWGARALAYEIRHKGEAEYHLFQFNATPALLERLHRTLRLTDGIVRFRIIKLAPGTPDPPAVRPEPPRPAESAPPAEAAPAEPTPEPTAEAEPAEAPAEAPAPAEPAPAPEPEAPEPVPEGEGAGTEEASAPAAE